ncbi:serine protease inhibitor 77Ba-like [Toxorhynchites rutilus septentrionalis]|uniref:serine protease inhibitor 77Ba-like n=1 Tax=Toxorhynchites rutilus septentrionalis TaxID=329112 RepID=UPI00247A6805|nr:serine protease inhibitor 77Ba-like [Toxorhynchites rutilus septentrionalis]XP_055642128.1 serine protease inhibitor 77Ba-like [Toxorhynchites rutilus septentrionalis]
MTGKEYFLLLWIAAVVCISSVGCQSTEVTTVTDPVTISPNNKLYQSSQKFALDFFKTVSEVVDSDPNVTTTNIIVSPLSVWSLLALITEGANGNTLAELLKVLNVEDQGAIKKSYKTLQEVINVNTSEVEISSIQFIFTDMNRPVQREFDSNIHHYYGDGLLEALDFSSNPQAIKNSHDRINQLVDTATKGQITKAVHAKDVIQARMIVVSALFFKGQWTLPFNRTLTNETPFYDENERVVGNVQMMYQKAAFPFAAFRELDAQIAELPYGSDRHLSMMLILPRKGVPLSSVIRRLADFNMATIYQELKQAAVDYEDDEIELYLPRFEITADYNLVPVLNDMGIHDAFNKETANFEKMSKDIFLGSVIQKSKIIVNEEGTTAAAATVAVFANKATPPRMLANRPFAFLIVDKRHDLILFMGQVKDPQINLSAGL